MKTKKSQFGISEKTFSLQSDEDLVQIREYGKHLAVKVGFTQKDCTIIATAISEICRNVIEYAGSGEVIIEPRESDRKCIMITVRDNGPGIEDLNEALEEGYSSGKGLGVGLPGAKRIMDEFDIDTVKGEGTTIKMCKWLNHKNGF